MSFDSDEKGVETSQPREVIDIAYPLVTYRLATGDQPQVVGGFTYAPFPAQRGEIAVSGSGDANGMEISIPVSHPAVQRYMRNGVPPTQAIAVTIQRLQLTSGQSMQIWTGLVSSLSVDRHVAKLVCSSRIGFALQRRIPTMSGGRECSYKLFDAGCQISRAGFVQTTTVVSREGSTVTVANMGGVSDQWAQFGELLHVASGERMTIGSQIAGVIQMQCPIAELGDGDAVQVFAGCARDITTCRDKFANVVNFANQPNLKTSSIYEPSSRGVVAIGNPHREVL